MHHRTAWLRVLIVCGLIAAVIVGTFRLATATTSDLPLDEVVVKLRSNVAIGTITSRYSATVIGRLIENRVYFLKLPAGQTANNLLPALNADADLIYAEPNYYNDPPPTAGQRLHRRARRISECGTKLHRCPQRFPGCQPELHRCARRTEQRF